MRSSISRRIRPARPIAALMLALILVGCARNEWLDKHTAMGPIKGYDWLIALDVVSVINTDRTLTDHAASLFTGRDCSTIRYLDGDHYCDRPPAPQPALYCYRSLGAIVCHSESDPHGDGKQPVDWPPTRSAAGTRG